MLFEQMELTPDLPLARRARNWKLTLSYDGTAFHGWQVQPGCRTIQGELAGALRHVIGESVLPQGSGRTDAGVHAVAQVASMRLQAAIPPANLMRALNRTLPADIRVLSAEIAADDFHARHSALGKTYEYRIFHGPICPPTLARYVYSTQWPLEMEAMAAAAPRIVGQHDFTSFAAVDPDRARRMLADASIHNVRTITVSNWRREDDLLIYTLSGSGFLHHMVRNLVGTFIEIGRGQRRPESIAAILDARERSTAGATAPARGLFLQSVSYPADTPSAVEVPTSQL
jgi:tRNA pseudouridine38-40 synthase